MYSFDIKDGLDKKLGKLSKKNPKQLELIYKKIGEIIQNPQHYKNLRAPMQHLKRVHIDKSFVLVFFYRRIKKNSHYRKLRPS